MQYRQPLYLVQPEVCQLGDHPPQLKVVLEQDVLHLAEVWSTYEWGWG